MQLIDSTKLDPGESISFKRPDGTEAAVFVSMSSVEVDTYEEDTRLKVEINFLKPFIAKKKND